MLHQAVTVRRVSREHERLVSFFSSPKRLDRLCDPHNLLVCVNRRFLLAGAEAAVKRITDLHILPMLRMRGAILFLIFVRSMYFFVLFYVFCVVLCIVCFASFSVLFVCICVLNCCHRVATQLQLNIYHIISYHVHLVHH